MELEELNQKVLGKVNEVHFPTIEPSKYLQAVNKILEAKLIKSALINFRSKEDQEWARQGLNLHKHSNGEYEQTCSFCGSPLSSERIEELNSYFSDEVKKLEIRINNVQEQLKQLKKSISNIMLPDPTWVAKPNPNFSHQKGITFDLTITDKDGNNLEMPTPFDDFNGLAKRNQFPNWTPAAQKNYTILNTAMEKAGFIGYENEWWDYRDTDADEFGPLEVNPKDY